MNNPQKKFLSNNTRKLLNDTKTLAVNTVEISARPQET